MQLIQVNTEHDDEEFEALSHIVHEMQVSNIIFNILLNIFNHNNSLNLIVQIYKKKKISSFVGSNYMYVHGFTMLDTTT